MVCFWGGDNNCLFYVKSTEPVSITTLIFDIFRFYECTVACMKASINQHPPRFTVRLAAKNTYGGDVVW